MNFKSMSTCCSSFALCAALALSGCSRPSADWTPPSVSVVEALAPAIKTSSAFDGDQLKSRLMAASKFRGNGTGLGLTSTSLKYEYSFTYRHSMWPWDLASSPAISVKLKLSPVIVYLAKELDRNACKKDAVLLHEMRHVQIHEDQVQAAAAGLQAVLNKIYPSSFRLNRRDKTAIESFERDVLTVIKAQIEAYHQRAQQINDELDSPSEYMRLTLACE